MKIDILSLFPDLFHDFLEVSIIGRAIKNNLLTVKLTDIRQFCCDKHKQADDYPYGGGAGLVMKPEPLAGAIKSVVQPESPVIYFTPQGRLLNQSIVHYYSQYEHLVLVCGHYKEIDQRIRDKYVTDELSVGDYVLSGGELPAMLMVDALTRLIDGAISDIESALSDSHQDGLLGSPYYTRPYEFEGMTVPEVLLSGDHQKIETWRREKAFELTRKVRPDLLHEE